MVRLMKLFMATLLFSIFGVAAFGQLQDIRVYNKTDCQADVTVVCSSSGSYSTTISADGYLDFACPTGNWPCEVIFDLPGGIFGSPDVETVNIYTLCSGSSSSNSNPSCYTQNIIWGLVPGLHYTLNIY